MICGAVLSAPYARLSGTVLPQWWSLLVAGTMLALVGTAVELGVEALGGLLVGSGAVLVTVAVLLGPSARVRINH